MTQYGPGRKPRSVIPMVLFGSGREDLKRTFRSSLLSFVR